VTITFGAIGSAIIVSSIGIKIVPPCHLRTRNFHALMVGVATLMKDSVHGQIVTIRRVGHRREVYRGF